MKKSVIDSQNKTYVYFDENDPLVVDFKKIWLKDKKRIKEMPASIIKVEGKTGFVGSGRWVYQMNIEASNELFEVEGFANGKGFWGTDYSIRRLKGL